MTASSGINDIWLYRSYADLIVLNPSVSQEFVEPVEGSSKRIFSSSSNDLTIVAFKVVLQLFSTCFVRAASRVEQHAVFENCSQLVHLPFLRMLTLIAHEARNRVLR